MTDVDLASLLSNLVAAQKAHERERCIWSILPFSNTQLHNIPTCIMTSNILVGILWMMYISAAPMERKIVTDDIKDLMNLLSGVKDWFVFGTFLGIPTTQLHDIEHNYPGEENLQRRLTEVVLS